VRDNRALDYEWFVKVDDDCFFFPENLRWYVQARGWSPLDAHYFGHKLYGGPHCCFRMSWWWLLCFVLVWFVVLARHVCLSVARAACMA
jgi:hypothetical protein